MGDGVSYSTIRDELASYLALMLDPIPVWEERPDALTPPCVSVEWTGTEPNGDIPGFVDHAVEVVVWPYTTSHAGDPTGTAPFPGEPVGSHYQSRDAITEAVISAVHTWVSPKESEMRSWAAATDERQLGQQTYQVAIVLVMVVESYLCP